jgi:SET domain-containing protein
LISGPAFDSDSDEFLTGIEGVCELRPGGSRQKATAGGTKARVGKPRRRMKRVATPLTVRPYQVTVIPGRGLGLTACSVIDPGTKIDDCFTWELPRRDIRHVTETVLNGNYFDHPLSSQRGLVAIGHISLINHDPDPNCEWRMLQVHDRWMVEAWSIRRLASGEELTFDYGYDPTAKY